MRRKQLLLKEDAEQDALIEKQYLDE